MLISNATILTFNEKNEVIEGGEVEFERGIITAVRRKRRKWAGAVCSGADAIDAGGRILMPGLVNTHMHLYSTFARGLALERSPKKFSEILKFLWWRLDTALSEEDILYSALIPLIQAVRSGVTSIFDHHCSPNFIDGSLDIIAEAFSRAGLRGCLCFEVSDRFGAQKTQAAIDENLRFIERCKKLRKKQSHKTPNPAAMFGLHASFTLGTKTLRQCVERKQETAPETGFHIHCAEGIEDVEITRQKYGQRVVERLYSSGILGSNTVASHCVHVTPAEIDILARTRTIVAHNPRSNMNNAVGISPVLDMTRRGVRLTLGTDGMSPRVQDDFIIAPLLQRTAKLAPGVFWQEAYDALTVTNQRMAGEAFGITSGVISKGAAADLILVDYFPPTPISADTLPAHFYFGLFDAPISATIVNGNILMHEGRLLEIDEDEIAGRSRELARRLWKRF